MSKFLFFLPVLASGGCTYQSMVEAEFACENWALSAATITRVCRAKQAWKNPCISPEEREARVKAAKRENTRDGMVDMSAVAKVPLAYEEMVTSPRRCRIEKDTKQVMGVEKGKGIVKRFRY